MDVNEKGDSESEYSDAGSAHSDEEEDMEDYKKNGYHPVSIGDRLHDDRYVIVQKLGWGHFSTVWLARDTKDDRHVALKIVKSSSDYTQSALEEIKLLERVKSANKDAIGWQYVAQLLDHFWHVGPNGKHMCMTFEVLGESLLSLIKRYNYRGIPPPIVKRITKQILQGLEYLHEECGIVHTDLKPENVLVWIPKVEEFLQKDTAALMTEILAKEQEAAATAEVSTKASAEQASGETNSNDPQTAPINKQSAPVTKMSKNQRRKQRRKKAKAKTDSAPLDVGSKVEQHMAQLKIQNEPVTIIPSVPLDFTSIQSTEDDGSSQVYDQIVVKIADLGNACWVEGPYPDVIQTRQYRSPEVIVGAKLTDRADMWSMACMVFELLTGEYLFDPRSDPRSSPKYNKDDDHLAQIIELMRVLPKCLTKDGEISHEFFTGKGTLRYIKRLRYRRLRDVLHDTFQMPPVEADSVNDFLLPMLEVDASKRAGPRDALAHAWLKDDTTKQPDKDDTTKQPDKDDTESNAVSAVIQK